jgi:hypothetical protein
MLRQSFAVCKISSQCCDDLLRFAKRRRNIAKWYRNVQMPVDILDEGKKMPPHHGRCTYRSRDSARRVIRGR